MKDLYVINLVFLCITLVLSVIGMWKLFVKFGEAGWKSLIPVYSNYMIFKIFWESKQFWMMLGLSLLFGVSYVCVIYNLTLALFLNEISIFFWIGLFLMVVFGIWNLVLNYKLCKNISNRCKKGMGTTLGLFFLMPIFLVWLGFTMESK